MRFDLAVIVAAEREARRNTARMDSRSEHYAEVLSAHLLRAIYEES